MTRAELCRKKKVGLHRSVKRLETKSRFPWNVVFTRTCFLHFMELRPNWRHAFSAQVNSCPNSSSSSMVKQSSLGALIKGTAEAHTKTEIGGIWSERLNIFLRSVHSGPPRLQMPAHLPAGITHGCTPSSWSTIQAQEVLARCRHCPPLTGAGLIQNMHQVAADETVRRIGETVQEDGWTTSRGAGKDIELNGNIRQRWSVHQCDYDCTGSSWHQDDHN